MSIGKKKLKKAQRKVPIKVKRMFFMIADLVSENQLSED